MGKLNILYKRDVMAIIPRCTQYMALKLMRETGNILTMADGSTAEANAHE